MKKIVLISQGKKKSHSKKLIDDVRSLLWVITVGCIALAFYCVYSGYTASLPWISAMVGLPWASHATICSFYLEKSKAENTDAHGNGITFAKAQAKNFMEEYERNWEKYHCGDVYNEMYTAATDKTEETNQTSPEI